MKPETKWKTFQDKLVAAYHSDQAQIGENKNFQAGSHLLQKVMDKEKLNCVVINLYPGNEGYSLMLKTKSGSNTETIRMPYEEDEILNYIDNEELPPLLIDILEKSQANVFYGGCVVCEIRDYRRNSNPSTCDYEHHYVLLKPSTQTVLSDVALLTNDGQKWSQDERLAVEGALLMISSEPLCLDPSVSVTIASNGYHHHKQKLSTVPLKKLARKYSQPAINRKKRFEHCPAPTHLKLFDVLAKHKRKPQTPPSILIKTNKDTIDFWKQKDIPLEMPESIDVFKYAKEIEKPNPVKDNSLITIEEYNLESEKLKGKVQITDVIIYQRPNDEQYLGKLTIRREGQESGSSCWYTLGHRSDVDKYINQCMEIFTEEGRKNVKITHVLPGKPPEITYTPNGASSST